MNRKDFLYTKFNECFEVQPTTCQTAMFKDIAEFITSDDTDIQIINGYAGTGKTSAISSVIKALKLLGTPSVLLAPTGRAAKVLSNMAHRSASTIHKYIYRQKSVKDNGYGNFTLALNKCCRTLFVVDEVSLITSESNNESNLFGSGNLLSDLIEFVRNGLDCKLILIGDAAQLPPVGLDYSPALSKEAMSYFGGEVRYSELRTVVRQDKKSGILSCATQLRRFIEDKQDFYTDLGLDISGVDDVVRIKGSELIEALSDAYAKYGDDETIVLCRSNKRAIRYNYGIRAQVQYKEEKLVKDDKLMIVKNCYQFLEDIDDLDYIANGDIAKLEKIGDYEERYGFHFANARLCFPDYNEVVIDAKVILDTLDSESASLTAEEHNRLYQGVRADYAQTTKSKARIWRKVREDPYFNALQLKYAQAITCHKSQGGQWDCVFIDYPFWQDEFTLDDLKWLYTAFTRAKKIVYLVNFKDYLFV